MKKKILYFINTPPPVHGGTIMNQIVNESKVLREEFRVRTLNVHYVEDVINLGVFSIRKLIITVLTLNKLVYEMIFHRPDLIYFQISHLGSAFLRDTIFVAIIKSFKVKLVYHLHGKGINAASSRNAFNRNLYKFVFHNTYVICLSELLVEDIKNVFCGPAFVVNNAIPYKDISRSLKKTHNDINILFLSNLIISKGILDFIDSLEILSKRNISFRANIIGAESELTGEQLHQILKNRNISHLVKYIGPIFGDLKSSYLDEADILAFPTYYHNECFPLVILEAMQFGIPVISTSTGAIEEIVDDEINGYIVGVKNPLQLAEKLEILITNDEKRHFMSKNARNKFYNNYTLDIFEDNMKNVLSLITQS